MPLKLSNAVLQPTAGIVRAIRVLRGQKVLLDEDLALLYGVETRRLNEQVRRNRERFPDDFMFRLAPGEFAALKSQIATSSWSGRRKLPFAFTEHGAIMAATVLNSALAIEMSVYVVRAFVQLRDLLGSRRSSTSWNVASAPMTASSPIWSPPFARLKFPPERRFAPFPPRGRSALGRPVGACNRRHPQRGPSAS